MRGAHKIWLVKRQRKRPILKLGLIWEMILKWNIVGLEDGDWFHLAYDGAEWGDLV